MAEFFSYAQDLEYSLKLPYFHKKMAYREDTLA